VIDGTAKLGSEIVESRSSGTDGCFMISAAVAIEGFDLKMIT